jgi:murein L,D-transpeptidase YafK
MKPILYAPAWLALCTMVTSFRPPLNLNTRYATANTYRLLVVKSSYELKVYDSSGEWLATYPVVFGNKDLGDKLMQGDRRTPEGDFHIISKKVHNKWSRFLLLDYPNAESMNRFNQRKAKGLIPKDAQVGGGIGIHGTWPNEDYAIDGYQNWTEGCISTKNKYIQELFDWIPVGTGITIRR